jgi:predicted ATPase
MVTVPSSTGTLTIQARFTDADFGNDSAISSGIVELDIVRANRSIADLKDLGDIFGRTEELREIKRKLRQARTQLLTLVGPSGCGKTRLALQIAAEMSPEFNHRVWVVEFGTLSDANPAVVEQKVAESLGLTEEPGRPLIYTLVTHLRAAPLLLVLDGCEHILSACAKLVDKLVSSVPMLKILATSIEMLGLSYEYVQKVAPLPIPDDRTDIQSLSQNACVGLFINKSESARIALRLSGNAQTGSAIAYICSRVAGIPLAVELVAKQTDMITSPPVRVAQKLDRHLRRHTGLGQPLLSKIYILGAIMNWSYKRLVDYKYDQALFRQLSIFPSSFTLEAAQDVFSNVPDGANNSNSQAGSINSVGETHNVSVGYDIEEGVNRLIEKGMLSVKRNDGEVRYVMHDALRRFGRETMGSVGEAKRTQRNFHDWCLKLVKSAEERFTTPERKKWLDKLEREQDNLRAAMALAISRGNQIEACELIAPLSIYWFLVGNYTEGQRWLEGALGVTDNISQNAEVAKALCGAGIMLRAQGGTKNLEQAWHYLSLSVQLWESLREANDPATSDAWYYSFALALLGLVETGLGDPGKGQTRAEAALSLLEASSAGYSKDDARKNRYRWCEAFALAHLGTALLKQGTYPEARELYIRSREIYKELRDTWGIGLTLYDLGITAYMQGDYPKARHFFEEGLLIGLKLGDRRAVAKSLLQFARLAQRQEQYAEAEAFFRNALDLYWKLEQAPGIIDSIQGIAAVMHEQGRNEEAARLLGALQHILAQADFGEYEEDELAREYKTYTKKIRKTLGEQAFLQAETEGRELGLKEIVGYLV